MGLFQDQYRGGPLAQHLREHGRPGQATITSLRPTGLTLAGHPQLEMDLDVAVGDASVYTVSHIQAIPTDQLTAYAVGATVAVLVDPEHRSSLILV